jgi:beta-N-acetylhexosaminidase
VHGATVRSRAVACSLLAAFWCAAHVLFSTGIQDELDSESRRWVDDTLAAMSVGEKIGQLLVPSFYSSYTSSYSETYDELTELIHEYHVGGMLVFGAREPRSNLLLDPRAARNILGQPFSAASLLNRLQAISSIPLLVAADFETGIGFRLSASPQWRRGPSACT